MHEEPEPTTPSSPAADATTGGQARAPSTGPSDAPGPHARPDAGPDPAAAAEGPPPDIAEALRQLGQTGRASLGAAGDAAKAFRSLIAADVSLARSAFGRSLAFTGVAIAFGASSWLLLMAAAVAFLSGSLGWSWATSLLVTAALSLLITVYGAWQAVRYFEHTRLKATRRQLARLGIGELSDFTPEPGSPERTRDRTRHDPPQTPDGKPLKDRRGVDVTPP